MSKDYHDLSQIRLDAATAAASTTKAAAKPARTAPGAPPVEPAVPGTILRAKIFLENWFEAGDQYTIDCGGFEIDACDFSGPPDIVTLKALSTPLSSSVMRVEKCYAWENVLLQEIAQDIASNAGMRLLYEVKDTIFLDRVDQLQQADLAFLQELCHNYGVAVKVTDGQIVLFDEADYEQKEPVDTLCYSEVKTPDNKAGRILSYKFSQDTTDTVSQVIVSYKDPKSGKLVQASFEPSSPPATGQVVNSNARPGNLSGDPFRQGSGSGSASTMNDFGDIRTDATSTSVRQAAAIAREKNKNEWNCEMTMTGNPLMAAGSTIDIEGFGVYDGKYIIEQAAHVISGGYTTAVKGHKVLEGY